MKPLNTFRQKLDQIVSDTKVQISSIRNDIKLVPETAQQLAKNTQVIMDEAIIKIEAMSKQLVQEKIFNAEYKVQIQKAVDEIQSVVNNTLDTIKDAINRAK